MTIKVNPEMVTLAREYRGLTQEQLGRSLGVTQAKIAKIEGGLQTEVAENYAQLLCETLGFPIDFFIQNEEILGWGSSAYYYRKKASITALDRKRIQSQVNICRIHIKKFLRFVEIESARKLPVLDMDEFSNSPIQAARAMRAFWNLPEGPIKNITTLLESAGVIVVPINFGTNTLDATCIRLAEIPPVVFINSQLPGDRWRWTLTHELAHLLMHEVPNEAMEDQADTFAAEFLLPELELNAQFSRMGKIRLADLCNLKPYWKVSMQALLMRASDLNHLRKSEAQYLWMQIGKLNYRTNEPHPLPKEEVKTYPAMVKFFEDELKYSKEEMAKLLNITPREVELLHGGVGAWKMLKTSLKIVSQGN
jgi:Zn-dependent peptidase ImmA (M78 family)/transcriptional regulator with XRE-family HTH domain